MTPEGRHAATLAALDRQTEVARKLLCEAQRVQLELQEPKLLGKRIPGWGWWPDVERMMAALVAQAAGLRSILVRHAPDDDNRAWCAHCTWEPGRGRLYGVDWPCPDWRDAAADLDARVGDMARPGRDNTPITGDACLESSDDP